MHRTGVWKKSEKVKLVEKRDKDRKERRQRLIHRS